MSLFERQSRRRRVYGVVASNDTEIILELTSVRIHATVEWRIMPKILSYMRSSMIMLLPFIGELG